MATDPVGFGPSGDPQSPVLPSSLAQNKQRDRDFFAWTEHQARLLRARRFTDIDADAVAQEIEALGQRDRRELSSRLTVLLACLLKWQFQPGERTTSWASTILDERAEIDMLLRGSPSLDRSVTEFILAAFEIAVLKAMGETGRGRDHFPASLPYSAAQMLDPHFWPGAPVA